MAGKAWAGLLKVICEGSMQVLKNGRPCRFSQGNPLRGAGASAFGAAVDGAMVDATGGGDAPPPNSGNFESASQFAIPSRQPRSVRAKRPLRSPSRTSSSENVPRLVVPRVM